MKHPNPFADFWLGNTHAFEVEPGHQTEYFISGEDSLTPWRTSTGRLLLVYASTFNELISLWAVADSGLNDHMGAKLLPEWPWTYLLEDQPVAKSQARSPFTFPGQEADKPAIPVA